MVYLFFLRVGFRVQLINLRPVVFIQQAVFISGFSGWPIINQPWTDALIVDRRCW
jgi:hypothetical protein